MRPTRTLTLLAGLAILVLAAGTTSACPGSGTKVSGTFDASGHFVLSGAWDKDGAPVASAKDMVLESFTTAANLVIPASSLAGKQVCLWGELDAAHKTMSVAGYKECGPGACNAKSAAACTSAKGTSAKGASAQSASAPAAGGCCAAGAKTAGAGAEGCGAKGASASAPAGCCAAGKAAQASSAGASCGAKAAAAGSSCGAGAAKAKVASAGSCGADAASTKANKMAKADDAPKADAAVATYVYEVSGMTCGGCASKVETAVTKLALPNVTGCTVDLEKARATITATGEVDREAIQKAITAAGFPAAPASTETEKS